MDVFEQEFLRPGNYPTDSGGIATVTAEDIRAHVDGTNQLIGRGWQPPVLFEHAPKGSEEGGPRNRRDEKAEQVKHGAGWLKEVKQRADGTGVYVLDVTDPAAAKKLREGSIKFTSPELRRSFLGQTLPHIAHVALTHKPRFIKQGAIQPIQLSLADDALQLSLEDIVDDEENARADDAKPSGEKKPDHPDAPESDKAPDPQFQALIAQLKEVKQIDLPSDVTPETFQRDLLTALKTAAAHEAKAKEVEAKDGDDSGGDAEPTEERPPALQFSLADVESGKVPSKLLGKVIKQNHDSLCGRMDSLVKDARITPGLQKQLTGNGALQFSAEGDEVPSFTLGQVVELLEEHTVPGQALDKSQNEQFSVEEPPIKTGADLTLEQAKKINDRLVANGLKL